MNGKLTIDDVLRRTVKEADAILAKLEGVEGERANLYRQYANSDRLVAEWRKSPYGLRRPSMGDAVESLVRAAWVHGGVMELAQNGVTV